MVDRVKIVVQDLTAFTEKVVRRLSIEAHANLVAAPLEGGTPIDTGWASANWVPSIGRSFEGTAGTAEQARARRVSTGQAEQGLAAVITRYRLRQGPVFISNNVPYIGVLNDGSSAQAPAGFVQKAIAEAVRAVILSPPRQ